MAGTQGGVYRGASREAEGVAPRFTRRQGRQRRGDPRRLSDPRRSAVEPVHGQARGDALVLPHAQRVLQQEACRSPGSPARGNRRTVSTLKGDAGFKSVCAPCPVHAHLTATWLTVWARPIFDRATRKPTRPAGANL